MAGLFYGGGGGGVIISICFTAHVGVGLARRKEGIEARQKEVGLKDQRGS